MAPHVGADPVSVLSTLGGTKKGHTFCCKTYFDEDFVDRNSVTGATCHGRKRNVVYMLSLF